MMDFQTLTLFSLTLLTAAMFIFYYLLVFRRTPTVTKIIRQTPIVRPSSSRTETQYPTLNTIGTRVTPSQEPIQIEAPIDDPTQTQSQTSTQTPVQCVSQVPVRAPSENALSLPAKPPILHGEAATVALKKFAEELEKREDTSVEKTRDASLIKLARVLLNIIEADKAPIETPKILDQRKPEVKHERKTTTESSHTPDRSHRHGHAGKKTKTHQPSRTRKTNRRTENKKATVKSKEKGRPTKKRSKHAETTKVHRKNAWKVRRERKNRQQARLHARN